MEIKRLENRIDSIYSSKMNSLKAMIALGSLCLASTVLDANNLLQTKVVLSPVYTIDRIYKSMEGPQSSQQITLLDGPPELVWITGFRTEMVGSDGKTPTLPEFMCHVNLDFDVSNHRALMGSGTATNGRILTLSQGQITVSFPEGFGMPVMSNERLSLNTQVLNHNLEKPNMQVRHKVTFDFMRDRDLKKPLKPLFNTSAFGMKLLEGKDGHYGMTDMDDSKHGPSCLPGAIAPNANGGSVYKDGPDKKFVGHWVVKPGREVNHSNVTRYLNLPFDTTLHYAAIHLHPFAESLELYDLTAKKTVFKSKARSFKDKIGLSYVDSFSSRTGVPLFKNHEYDLISTYNNTTSEDKDSMAVMLLFALDANFKKPVTAPPPPPPFAPSGEPVRLHTTLGDLVVGLDPRAAPNTVRHFLELVQAGAYDGTPVINIQPGFIMQFGSVNERRSGLTEPQRALVHRVPLEVSGLIHQRGVLSMARDPHDPNSAESSFCILLGNAPHLDGHYTIFGRVEKGLEVLEGFEKASRDPKNQPARDLRIEKADLATASPVKKSSSTLTDTRLRLKTSLGEMGFKLYADVAPQTVEQISRLVRAGLYDSVRIFRVEPRFVAQLATVQDRSTPLNAQQKALVHKIPAEFSALRHRRGILSMARQDNDINSAESSFSILLGNAPHLDGKYTIFGELDSGSSVLSAIEESPRKGNAPIRRIEVLKAEIIGGDSAKEAPSCHPNEGEAMPEHLAASAKDPLVTPTDKIVETEQGVSREGEHYKTLVFKGMEIDKLYPSMRGPWTRAYLNLKPEAPRLWITGYRAEVLDGENGRASQEFMCHTKLDQVKSSGNGSSHSAKSFFVISQGQDEVRFPKGFGLRVENDPDQRYDLNVMVLNNNYPMIKRKLDFKATISYLKDQEAKDKGYIPLSIVSTSIFCSTAAQRTEPPQEACEPASPGQMQGPDGSTGHWFVPPGRHSYRQFLSLGISKDTTVHYIMAHLHPHAESVEIKDMTTQEVVWKGKMSNNPDATKSYLSKTEHFSSVKGKRLFRDHQYELVATYNNPTAQKIDAMASFWIYVRVDPA